MSRSDRDMDELQNEPARTDRSAQWKELRAPSSPQEFYRAWLALQCAMIPDVLGGLVLAGPPGRGPYAPVALWPRVYGDVKRLGDAGERALRERGSFALEAGGDEGRGAAQLAHAFDVAGELAGAVVLDLAPRGADALADARERLAWGCAWLELFLREQQGEAAHDRSGRLETLLGLVASVPERGRLRAGVTHLATELATELGCDRVSVGLARRGHVALTGLSHSAQFGQRSNLVRAIEAAMHEALEQEQTLCYPDTGIGRGEIVRAHAELAEQFGSGAIASVLLAHQGQPFGVLTLERGVERPFDDESLAMAEAAAALVGPTLDLQRREERWLLSKAAESLATSLRALLGAEHVAAKLGVAAAALLVLFFAFAKGDYRVSARTLIEPEVQRAAVAPFDGYLAAAPVRAGDLVSEGQILARLDDRDLTLERVSWQSEVEQLSKQNRQARAEGNAAQLRILSAAEAQARAQLELVEDRLSRTEVKAPFDGVIVQGDLSQELGAPLQRGEVMFEIAPLEAYRVILEVDESEIREVAEGQPGRLVLTAAPGRPLPFRVAKITPVSSASEGRNFFRVEARLDDVPERLRPGMEGVGKIDVEQRRLIWIWTHQGLDWLRLALWRWLP